MASRSKAKGSNFERSVVERLQTWWGSGSWNRSPSSGALRWNGKFFTYGDVIPAEDFPGIIECKHYAEISYNWLISNPLDRTDGILMWWIQVLTDQARCLKETGLYLIPVLVFKQNRGPMTLTLPLAFFEFCFVGSENYPGHLLVTVDGMDPFVIIDLETFLSRVNKETFLQAHRDLIAARVVPEFLDEVHTP